MGFGKKPTSQQQDVAYELTQSFFEQAYATLSALASVHGRIRVHVDQPEPPIKSNDKFLAWWRNGRMGESLASSLDTLCASRDFRTVFMHPQMWPVFDWGTASVGEDLRVVLHGAESSKGNTPPGASRAARSGHWEFVAPDMDAVLEAFEQLCDATFGPIFTWHPEDERATPCTWEPDGIGSTIGDRAAEVLREAVSSDDLDPDTRARLAPRLVEDLDEYIKAMAGIRGRAQDASAASAYPSDVPAARPASSLGRPAVDGRVSDQ